jgi:hypothetical protein
MSGKAAGQLEKLKGLQRFARQIVLEMMVCH